MFWVISAPDKSDWRYSRDALSAALKRDWPELHVEVPGSGDPRLKAEDLIWKYPADGAELEGSQHRSGQATYLEGRVELVARYAAWWRAQVDPQQPLILYDEAYTTVVPLESGVDAASIARAMDALHASSHARQR